MAKAKRKSRKPASLLDYLNRVWAKQPVWRKILLLKGAIIFWIAILIWLWFCVNPDFAKFSAYLIGGSLLILQIIISNRRATAAENTAAVMQQTAAITEKGNVAERFKSAIEHLANENASVRLGGIYTLHHIAEDVKEYRTRVFEILCAHIRETTTHPAYKEKFNTAPSIEIQSILGLLFDKTHRQLYRHTIGTYPNVNLDGAFLSGADLIFANLQGVTLKDAILDDANLFEANLQDAVLWGTGLRDAVLSLADLQEASLLRVSAIKTDFDGASLSGTDISECDLSQSQNLSTSQLLKAYTLKGTKLPDEIKKEIMKTKPELLGKS